MRPGQSGIDFICENEKKINTHIILLKQKKRIYDALLNSNSSEVNNFNIVIKRIINEKIRSSYFSSRWRGWYKRYGKKITDRKKLFK